MFNIAAGILIILSIIAIIKALNRPLDTNTLTQRCVSCGKEEEVLRYHNCYMCSECKSRLGIK